MKRLLFLTACLCALFMSMSAQNPLIGKWVQVENEQGVSVTATYDFADNGTLVQTMLMTSKNPKMLIDAVGTCTYTYADNTITFKFSAEDFVFNNFEIEGVPQAAIDQAMGQMKAGMVNQQNQLTNVKIEGNIMTANFQGQTITLTRAK